MQSSFGKGFKGLQKILQEELDEITEDGTLVYGVIDGGNRSRRLKYCRALGYQ